MKIKDVINASGYIFKRSKFRVIISILTTALLSTIIVFFWFVGFSYSENSKKIDNSYLNKNPISVFIDSSNNVYNDFKRYHANDIIAQNSDIILMEPDLINSLKIVRGNSIKNHSSEVLASANSSYSLGDVIIINGLSLTVCGIYESMEYYKPIGDISRINIDKLSFILIYDEYSDDLIDNVDKLLKDYSSYFIEYDDLLYSSYKNHHKYAQFILLFFIVASLLLLIPFIGLLYNSMDSCLKYCRGYFSILTMLGARKNNVYLINLFFSSMCIIPGYVASILFTFVISKTINLKIIDFGNIFANKAFKLIVLEITKVNNIEAT